MMWEVYAQRTGMSGMVSLEIQPGRAGSSLAAGGLAAVFYLLFYLVTVLIWGSTWLFSAVQIATPSAVHRTLPLASTRSRVM